MSYAAAATTGLPMAAIPGSNNSKRSQRNIVLTRMKDKCQGSNNPKKTPKSSIVERLQACLENDKIRDLYLVAKDGVRVPALRCVLASASPVLERMLYGDFCESHQTEIELGEDGRSSSKTLEALVEFCCSDQLTTTRWKDLDTATMMEDVMSVARLGHTYTMPALQEAVHDLVLPRLQEDPSLACVVLKGANPMSTPELYAAAMEIIRIQPYMALKSSPSATAKTSNKEDEEDEEETMLEQQSTTTNTTSTTRGGIVCLPPEQLEEILQEDVECDEFFLFQCLLDWRDYNQDTLDADVNVICEQLVRRHIRLACIDPEDLKSTVMSSGFVSQELLLEAFMQQALLASRDGITFATLRSAPEGEQHQGHVLVQGAGHSECNGLYTQQRNLSFPPLVYYSRYSHVDGETYYLVKDRTDPNWKISANGTTFYEWKTCEQSEDAAVDRAKHIPPQKGWSVHLPCASTSAQLSIPTCKFFRPATSTSSARNGKTTAAIQD
ncbi:expressed unknown protein [Seminavis robusta]|uniref:BTB domain-containing protein n=1 Tax=Seminavis robusta TaxID=568900 RepID=A0A9N8DF86_9STRA|nr:expressed unknown protein [Seminavis robusta]|eukprot:Sro65_g036570.1 n/a (496) ;mRNA; r:17318-18805